MIIECFRIEPESPASSNILVTAEGTSSPACPWVRAFGGAAFHGRRGATACIARLGSNNLAPPPLPTFNLEMSGMVPTNVISSHRTRNPPQPVHPYKKRVSLYKVIRAQCPCAEFGSCFLSPSTGKA
jgi:hypothetical protein